MTKATPEQIMLFKQVEDRLEDTMSALRQLQRVTPPGHLANYLERTQQNFLSVYDPLRLAYVQLMNPLVETDPGPGDKYTDYEAIELWGLQTGSGGGYRIRQQGLALVDRAPKDAIYERDGKWRTVRDLAPDHEFRKQLADHLARKAKG